MVTPNASDANLIHLILQRDDAAGPTAAQAARAFEALYTRYAPALQRHLLGILRDEAAAQDLLQEVFLRVWLRAEQWNGQGSFKAWLYRIATNLALNVLRAQKRQPTQPLRTPDETGWDEWSEDDDPPHPGWLVDASALGPPEALERAEQRRRLQEVVAALPEEKREVFRLVHDLELSIHDAAGMLGIPEGTVKSRLYYAQKRVHQALNRWEE